MIDDMNYLEGMMRLEYDEIPYFMVGHSMGSFLTREYMALYGDKFDGAVFIGTGLCEFLIGFRYTLAKIQSP